MPDGRAAGAGAHEPARVVPPPRARARRAARRAGGAHRRARRAAGPEGLVGKVKALGQLRELASFTPKVVKKAAFREVVVDPPDLTRLPVLTTWPGDGGPFITLPVVVTKDARGGATPACTGCRSTTARPTGMHWHLHHDGAANFREADGRLEVAVALGTDPAVTYAATAPLPPGIDEFMFAGFLRGEPVELAPCATVDLEVPADAEIVLEGYVEKGETAPRGTLRRPHRLLLARRRLPCLPRHGDDAPPRPDLPGDHRRPPADGGLPTSARRPSGSSCRCCGSCSPRSSTWTCRSRACSTTARSSRSARRTPGRRAR